VALIRETVRRTQNSPRVLLCISKDETMLADMALMKDETMLFGVAFPSLPDSDISPDQGRSGVEVLG
jgi:hypothetical protein